VWRGRTPAGIVTDGVNDDGLAGHVDIVPRGFLADIGDSIQQPTGIPSAILAGMAKSREREDLQKFQPIWLDAMRRTGGDPGRAIMDLVQQPGGFDMFANPRIGSMLNTILGLSPAPEEYTLSPGQTRFRGDKPLASVPEAPPEIERKLTFAEKALGRPLSAIEKQRALGIAPPSSGDTATFEVVDIPNIGTVQRNKRTGQLHSMPSQGGSLSPSDVAGPILAKVARGEELTPAETQALDIYRRLSPVDRLIEQSIPGPSGGPTVPAGPQGGASPGSAPTVAAPPVSGDGANLYGRGSSRENPIIVQTPQEAAALAPGTYYATPDGQIYRR
jgi:hypothetical protein